MRKYKLSQKAEKDLEEIFTYSKLNWGVSQAQKYVRLVSKICNSLSNLSNIGTLLDNDSENNIRKILVGKHLIFYQVQDDTVWILRILSSGMDVEDLDFDNFLKPPKF